jgi:hypothetical protein
MGAAESRAAFAALAAAGALTALAAGCASDPSRPDPLPPQAVTQHRPEPAPPIPRATPAPAPKPETLVVIEPPERPEDRPPTLAEAAQKERERRLSGGGRPPVAVINNQNLAEFAKGQKLTMASPEPGAGEADGEAEAAAGELAAREAYWRERGLEIRQRWRDALDAVARLEVESADLRRRFYSTDDPYVRDGQVKPEWDRVLVELDRARREVTAAPRDLADYFDEARREGALPGWLEDGIELEPEPAPEERPRRMPEADIGEPPLLEEEPGDP